ncbi:MAG: hypothetical protein CMH83_01285 [Nocardioides sp.]|nr:hypothetical protein [Nocardioides sp.]
MAVGCLTLAAVAVLGAFLSGSFAAATTSAVVAFVLGAAATKITHSEVLDTRRLAAKDRAQQAQAYRVLTEERVEEQAVYVAETSGRLARHEATIGRLEKRLADAAAEVSASHQALDAERERHESLRRDHDLVVRERDRMGGRLEEAEERAALAVVRVAELEQELDVALAELRAAHVPHQSTGTHRKHA